MEVQQLTIYVFQNDLKRRGDSWALCGSSVAWPSPVRPDREDCVEVQPCTGGSSGPDGELPEGLPHLSGCTQRGIASVTCAPVSVCMHVALPFLLAMGLYMYLHWGDGRHGPGPHPACAARASSMSGHRCLACASPVPNTSMGRVHCHAPRRGGGAGYASRPAVSSAACTCNYVVHQCEATLALHLAGCVDIGS